MVDRSSRIAPCSILAVVVALSVLSLSCTPQPEKEAFEVVDIPGPTFTIRISAFHEKNGWPVAGAYYRFESVLDQHKTPVRAMEFRHDDPVPIPRHNVKFLTPTLAVVFMGWKYAVTTDGGKNWDMWSALTDLPNWKCCNYNLIEDVELASNGLGTMKLRPMPGRRGEVDHLVTDDFGRHWSTVH